MQMTTREAVKRAIYAMADTYTSLIGQPEEKKELMAACDLLCQQYGFKLESFFNVEDVN